MPNSCPSVNCCFYIYKYIKKTAGLFYWHRILKSLISFLERIKTLSWKGTLRVFCLNLLKENNINELPHLCIAADTATLWRLSSLTFRRSHGSHFALPPPTHVHPVILTLPQTYMTWHVGAKYYPDQAAAKWEDMVETCDIPADVVSRAGGGMAAFCTAQHQWLTEITVDYLLAYVQCIIMYAVREHAEGSYRWESSL